MPKIKLSLWVDLDDEGTVTDLRWDQAEPEKRIAVRRRVTREVRERVEGAARTEEAATNYLRYLNACVAMGLRVALPTGNRNYINVWHTDDRNYRAACLTIGSGLLHIPYATEALPLASWTAMPGVAHVTNNGELTSGVKIYLNDEERISRAVEMTRLVRSNRYSNSGSGAA